MAIAPAFKNMMALLDRMAISKPTEYSTASVVDTIVGTGSAAVSVRAIVTKVQDVSYTIGRCMSRTNRHIILMVIAVDSRGLYDLFVMS